VQIQFGTDGWRGVIAREFTFDNLARVAQATMDYLIREGLAPRGIVIGYDRRFLSREFAERVAEIAAGNGIRVWLTDGYAPTPAVSWAVRELGAGGGVMITASHNPPAYNGFKVKEAFGGSARPATTKILEEMVAANDGAGREIQSRWMRSGRRTSRWWWTPCTAPAPALSRSSSSGSGRSTARRTPPSGGSPRNPLRST
jgi:phosphomannomutase